MAITYKSAGDWGPGKGAPLTAEEIDSNFYQLTQQLTALRDDPNPVVSIESVEAFQGGFKIIMADATEYGPFYIPMNAFRWRGDWAPETEYMKRDIFQVEGVGLVVTLISHTSLLEFSLNTVTEDEEAFAYQLMFADTRTYDICYYAPGVIAQGLDVDSPILQIVAARNFFIPSTDSGYVAGYAVLTTANAAPLSFVVAINGEQVATIAFDADATTGTLTVDDNAFLTPGDVLTVLQPVADTEHYVDGGAGLSITLKTLRGAA